jgi:hypothetical protein
VSATTASAMTDVSPLLMRQLSPVALCIAPC